MDIKKRVEDRLEIVKLEDIEKIKRLAPPFDKERMREEARKDFPFVLFGRGGGFGFVRGKLRDAILHEQWDEAEELYYLLLLEGVDDALFEEYVDSIEEYFNGCNSWEKYDEECAY